VPAPDLDACPRFLTEKLTRIPGVSTIRTSFALEDVVRRRSLPLDHPG
jgi:DNA-binding Lrp family transcriptional regulator